MSESTQNALMAQDIKYIKNEVHDIKTQFASSFMSRSDGSILEARVLQLERIVYGMVGIILIGVLGSIVGLVLK